MNTLGWGGRAREGGSGWKCLEGHDGASQVLFFAQSTATEMCSLCEKCTELQLSSLHFSVCVIEIKTQDTQNAGLRPKA